MSRAERIQQLFLAICDLDPEARRRVLDEECSGDSELRAEIEKLLAHDSGRTTESDPATGVPLERIDSYVLIRKLGEGGMGTVYLAERADPRMRCALKVIKRGMDSRQVLARFQSEREALARMKHPNVAAFLDAGTIPDGRPYYVMEHVEGIPITEHCDRFRLDLRDRLELFAKVCAGVHHAHQKGVIHRDIKPTNVLVEYDEHGRATPKIIDFGVAKALYQPLNERTFFTEHGRIIGTPEYMSPEQAEPTDQDIDIRADVYSLGVLLYELLTGSPPFDRETFRRVGLAAMLQVIRETDPPKPSSKLETLGASDSTDVASRRRVDLRTLTRMLRADLDWVIMMCLEKDRARRYASAAALADDVQRYLAQQPVAARPPSLAYRAQKLWRRRRGAIATSATIAIVFMVALVVVTALWAKNTQIRSVLQKQEAKDLVQEARLLGYQYTALAAEKLALAIELDPDAHDARLERARLHRRQRHRDEAIAEARELLRTNPASGEAAALLAGLLRRSDPQESERLSRRAQGLLDAPGELYAALAFGEDDDREAIRLFTRSLEENPWNFDALWQRGVRRFGVRELDGALQDADLMVKVRGDLALAWITRGAILLQKSRLKTEGDHALIGEAIECFDRAVAKDPNNWIAYYNRALGYGKQNRHEQALEDLDRAARLRPGGANIQRERGANLQALGRFDESVSAYEAVLRLGANEWPNHLDLAYARCEAGRFADAVEEVSAALGRLPSAPQHADDRRDLLLLRAEILGSLGRFDEARAHVATASAGVPEAEDSEAVLGRIDRLSERHASARSHFDRALALSGGNVGYHLEKGIAAWRAGDIPDAVADLTLFAQSAESDGAWVRLYLWEIEALRGNTAAAARQLDAAEASAPTDPLLAQIIRVARGAATPDTVSDLARDRDSRLHAYYFLGALSLARSQEPQAREWFRRCTALGMLNEMEHELAAWRLRQLG